MLDGRVAVVGELDSIYGFSAIGVEVFAVKSSAEVKVLVERLINENFAVIYITESMIAEIYSELIQFVANKMTAIIPIPGLEKASNLGMNAVRELVKKAVGMDILTYEAVE